MPNTLGHIEFRVSPENLPFYRDLFAHLAWDTIADEAGMLGVSGPGGGASLWLETNANGARNDYDGAGVNHIAFAAQSQAEVDASVEWLRGRGIETLFGTPTHRPEFGGDGNTYYQVMFESPDRILLEVVYTGPKQ